MLSEFLCVKITLRTATVVVDVVFVEAWRLELTRSNPRIGLGYFTLKAVLLYPPHTPVKRLHGHDSYIVILIPETVD